ncbi:MAG: alkaline phosphatase family protein [Planctomycetota bacterium]|nr:alkaline phosphatase family protein [Planctomycetota bacterium]
MKTSTSASVNRRAFLQRAAGATALSAAGVAGGAYWLGSARRAARVVGRKVIVIGIDGMDPQLCARMMQEGRLPHLQRLSATGGFSRLGTSVPPQSPVAWANFINGAGPGSHGIFDFIHRHPQEPCAPFYAAAETLPGEGGWDFGDHRLRLPCWPFRHTSPATVLRRQGVPFWDYLDAAKIPSTFYDLPSNYPPSPSQYGYHRCLCGMGTPDLLGTYGTYQHFSEVAPEAGVETGGGQQMRLVFDGDTARVRLVGPENSFLKAPQPTTIELAIHRDRRANAALLEVQGRKLLLQAGQWSPWTKLDFAMSTPACLPTEHVSGICRFYLQEVAPNFRVYVTPINADPTQPAVKLSEPAHFVQDVSEQLGLFYTTGFQEDHKARSQGVFDDSEFLRQATMVLDERLALLEYALENYDDGLLFFYFSSSDLQSHLFWWDSDQPHPTRSGPQAKQYFRHVQQLYQRLDAVVGDIHQRYGGNAAIFVISDHGFANFGRQFNLNSWLRNGGFLKPAGCNSILQDADWFQTRAYGLGINGLYLNLKGRERDGIVEPGEEQEELTRQLIAGLQAVRDGNGQQVIRQVYRTDKLYSGSATELAPDLIVGYARGYRASWETCLGELTPDVLTDNQSAWSADHCADASVIPGVLCCNRPIRVAGPALTDLAPTILAEFGLPTPSTMSGRILTVS